MHLSLVSVLEESALRRPDKVAVVEGVLRATYAELWDAALRRAGALREAGVEPGDRVALLGLNTIDFVTAYYGILARGAVVVPVAPMLVPDEVAFLVEDREPRSRWSPTTSRRSSPPPPSRPCPSAAPAPRRPSPIARRASRWTRPCCSTRAARPAGRRARCSPTSTW